MIQTILVLGGGSAGLIAAISLKRKIPQLVVRVVRSPEIGVIGVGEGTTPNFPQHLFDYLQISRKVFYQLAQPTWKLGIRFLWGPRRDFFYTFSQQLDSHWTDLPRPNGFYCDEQFNPCDVPSALMMQDKAFPSQPNGGGPDIQGWHAFHIENKKLVDTLELCARSAGVEFVEGKVLGAERGPGGIAAVRLEDGRRLEAEFFIDASGFRSELLGKSLQEPYIRYDRSLFCDRAVVGGWERTVEPILPYTTSETMNAGWAWQIEHEHFINRGYVYASSAISDDEALEEFRRKNPKISRDARVVKFKSGRYQRAWAENVVGIGNAIGFVEPLEASAIMLVCAQSKTLVDFLLHSNLSPTPTMRQLYNDIMIGFWDEVRDFLAIHYKFNTLLDTPFWRRCQNETDVSAIQPLLDFYHENGPTGFSRHLLRATGSSYGIEGFLVMLVGNSVPYKNRHKATAAEREAFNAHRRQFHAAAQTGMDVKQCLACIRNPAWRWHAEA